MLEKTVVTPEFCARKDVYNINVGGEGGWNYINSAKLNIGFKYANEHGLNNKADQCHIVHRKIKSDPEFAKAFGAAISKGLKKAHRLNPEKFDISGSKNPMFGKTHSEESRQKISKANSGKNNPMESRMWVRNS